MVNPVPPYPISTPYGIPGPYWDACGWHTGLDIAAPYDTPVVAARGGECLHVDLGSAFGYHQFLIRPGDGTQDFYAHTGSRPAHHAQVATGQQIAHVSTEGNSTGPHLHLERHIREGGWSCSTMTDPIESVLYEEPDTDDEEDDTMSQIIWIAPNGTGGVINGNLFCGIGGDEASQLRSAGWREVYMDDATADIWRKSGVKGL